MNGKKTYLTALAALLTAWGAYLAGAMTLAEAIQASFAAVLAATLRHGIGTQGVNGITRALPVLAALAALAMTPALTSCQGVTVEPGGVCIVQDGWKLCWQPADNSWTAVPPDGGAVQTLTFHPGTRTWRADTPAGTIIHDGKRIRLEPPLPQK